jgi:hypothetical protein
MLSISSTFFQRVLIAHVHFCFQLSHKTQTFKSGDCGGKSSDYELFAEDSSVVSIELLVAFAVVLSHIKFPSDSSSSASR